MKSILNKFFPDHDAGTAATVLFFILSVLLMSGITVSDYFRNGYADDYQLGLIGFFVLLAAVIYHLGRKGKRVGK